MRAVGIAKRDSKIVQIILRQLPERYDTVKTMSLVDPQITRPRLENTICSAYSQRKAHAIAKRGPAAGTPAGPPNPHALVVGRGYGDRGAGGGGGHQMDDGMIFRGGGMPRQPKQQQHWSRGGGIPWRQQQQQHWSRGGGMPRQPQQQQQWSRGGGIPHQRSSHSVPPARQTRLPPSREIPSIGVGGIYDCGSNAVYDQQDSPPPPGAPMCAVYRCGRCGKHGHKSGHCAAPRRFEGTCGACGQYGHMWRNCAISSRHSHLNVFTSSGECYVNDAHGADTIVIPQQHHQPVVDLGGEDIPFQQPSDTMHYSIGISGGGREDGDALGTDVPSGGGNNDEDDWDRGVTRQQQIHMQDNGGVMETSGAPGRGSRGDREDGSGPLSGTFSGGDDGAVYGGFFTLQHLCSINPNPSSPMLSAISSLFTNRRPGSTIFLGDTGAVIHGVSSADCVCNRRKPRPWERHLMVGNGKCTPVDFYGDLDLDLHCDQDVRVTLTNVAVVPGLAFDIMSFNRIQEKHEIILNGAGASMLGGRVKFEKFRAGNFIQATRIPHNDASPHPPAMVAAMMRPGAPSSMNVNDFHNSLGHANVKALHETAKQMGIKLTGIQEYCDGCAAAKAIKRAIPKVVDSSRKSSRPFQRIFMDLAGGYPKSTGGAKYLMQLVDDYTNFGWTVFLGDKSGPTVVRAFRTWYASVKHLVAVHGEVGCVLTDNGTEWVNEDFRTLLVDLGIGRELTAVDAPQSNGRVERRIALVSEGAKAAFVEFPKQFPDITFPARTKSYAAIWPEAFTWMNDCLNITAAVHKDDKRCPEEKLYGKRRVQQAWPFMMPGFRHRNRATKMHDKGERCFYLNSGNDHSSNTHKVVTPAGIATYSAHCTFGYRRQAFQGEVPTWGGGAVTTSLAETTSSRGGGFPAATLAASAAPRGGGIPPMFSSGAAPTSLAEATSSCGGGFPAATPAASAAPRGGGIPPMFSSGAAPTSLAEATSSRGGGFPAATPAASAAPRGGGIPPMFSSGAAPTSLAETTSSRGGGFPAATPAASAAPRGGGIPPMFSSGAAPTSLAEATSSRGGGFPAATPAASTAPRGGGIPPMFSSGGAPTSLAEATSSRGGGFPATTPAASAAPRGGGIPPMFSSEATTTSAATASSSRGGGITAAVPAAEVTSGTHVSGSGVGPPAVVDAAPTPPTSDPSVATGTATGELLATGQEQLVTSDGRREVLAEISRMAGGTSPVDPGTSGPPDWSTTAVLADDGKDSA